MSSSISGRLNLQNKELYEDKQQVGIKNRNTYKVLPLLGSAFTIVRRFMRGRFDPHVVT